MSKVLCGSCQTGSMEVVQSRIKAKVYRCASCGDTRIWGPCCGQGWVRPLRIRKLNEIVLACRECETMWKRVDDVGSVNPHMSLSRYMDEHGIRSEPSEIEEMRLNCNLEPISSPAPKPTSAD